MRLQNGIRERGGLRNIPRMGQAMSNRLVQLTLYSLRLPFRRPFAHAAASRDGAETLILAALLADGTIGFGEAIPRGYVTGETLSSVIETIQTFFAPRLSGLEPKRYADVMDFADQLPCLHLQGKNINCARGAVELALLDAYGRFFGESVTEIIPWLGFGAFAQAGSVQPPPVSGVLGTGSRNQIVWQSRLMRWYGLRDFKIKLGDDRDEEMLRWIESCLSRDISQEDISIRADANGAWDIDTALGRCERLAFLHARCMEEPLHRNDKSHWRTLADLSEVPLMADDSLLTLSDARYLAENDLVDYFNIRIGKNGGLIPSIRLAEYASKSAKQYQLGAMVGESGILTAAGIQFLQMVPDVRFTEIGYSTFLLQRDLVRPSVRFRWGGKLPVLNGSGLGVEVQPATVSKFLTAPPCQIPIA